MTSTIVRGKITGQEIDTAHLCPECEHWWDDHRGPVINWERQCSYRDSDLDHPCKCMVDLHKYPQALWDKPTTSAWEDKQPAMIAYYQGNCMITGACEAYVVDHEERCPSWVSCKYATSTHDPVNHPSHYTSHPSGVECIAIAEHYNFCLGNALKYIWRAGLKDASNEIEDLEKAVWYIQREIMRLEELKSAARAGTNTTSS